MSKNAILYHNPRCSKSRAALTLLQLRDIKTQIIDYQANPPSADTLRTLVRQLGIDSPRAMMRTKEALYAELNLSEADDEALIAAMAAHPKLIERPIAVIGDKAAIGRPLENIEALL
ncbi:arsenate reductase [Neisseria sp. HSC-16F19]|nr:arsenate reductase (glutaredoxin) [Neisseria sp. HSC-16F19]MCP2041757.1 arsenate reductase [Neisseria sp. HSC-16F19]